MRSFSRHSFRPGASDESVTALATTHRQTTILICSSRRRFLLPRELWQGEEWRSEEDDTIEIDGEEKRRMERRTTITP